ncbi:hypothetical protein PInf_014400 [Phytophthora infestans]|nr:hypothetical protein PInf_014400 [Phytophthora infestans]
MKREDFVERSTALDVNSDEKDLAPFTRDHEPVECPDWQVVNGVRKRRQRQCTVCSISKRKIASLTKGGTDATATTTPTDMIENEEANRNIHLSRDDNLIMVNWMEVEDSLAAIHGSGDKIRIGGKPKIKNFDASTALAKHVISKTDNNALRGVGLTGQKMQQRWRAYMRRSQYTVDLP